MASRLTSIAIDMFRLDISIILSRPFLCYVRPHIIIIRPGRKIAFTFGTIQSAISNHFNASILFELLIDDKLSLARPRTAEAAGWQFHQSFDG